MKRIAALAGALLALAAGQAALAQPGDGSRRFERMQQQREFQRQREQEFQRREQRPQEQEGRPGRLSPEERQQLRRDIREHGREVYRPRSQR